MRIPDVVGTRMGDCEISSVLCESEPPFHFQPAPVLAGVNVVRPVGRSTLTPAPGRRAQTLPRRRLRRGQDGKTYRCLTRPDPMGEGRVPVNTALLEEEHDQPLASQGTMVSAGA